MTVLHTTQKGPMLNTLEKFYIYQATRNGNQLNDKNTVTTNTIFDTKMQHSKTGIPRFRTAWVDVTKPQQIRNEYHNGNTKQYWNRSLLN